jgi:hypothetical protein
MKITPKTWTVVGIGLLAVTLIPAMASAQAGTMFVLDDKVGIGIDAPVTPLHVFKSGQVQFRFQSPDAAAGGPSIYDFKINTVGNFDISRVGTGSSELQVRQANDAAGPTVVIFGSSRATAHLTTSTRSAKQGFQPIDNQEILSKVASLPITRWSFIKDPNSDLHIGPVAEDFRAAFNLGMDDKTIATVDADGIALASIQALHSQLQVKDEQISDLLRRVEQLEALLSSR